MHVAYISLFGVSDNNSVGIFDMINFILISNVLLLDIYDSFCVNNRIFYLRLRGISLMSIFDLSSNSISGVLARATGICYDLRALSPYECYNLFNFEINTSFFGDALDRVTLRNLDMRNSIKIIYQAIHKISGTTNSSFIYSDVQIENLIFLFYTIWINPGTGVSYSCIEAPKGEYNVFIFSFATFLTRVRIRCSDFVHLLVLDNFIRGYLLGDLVALIGNIDCVFGSIDR